jgi:hypothetical protein
MPAASLAAFVVGVCILQWQRELPAWPMLLFAVAAGSAMMAASLRAGVPSRAALALACGAALLLGFSHAGRPRPLADRGCAAVCR